MGKLNKDISFALRRGTIAQVTTALDAALRFAEDELALNEARCRGRSYGIGHIPTSTVDAMEGAHLIRIYRQPAPDISVWR